MRISPLSVNIRQNIFKQRNLFNNQKDCISFNAVTPKKIIASISEDNFPSKYIFEKVQQGYKNDTNFSLYMVHKDYYKGLFDCSTLDEAKEKYPEFQNVKDAKNSIYSNAPYSIKQIMRGEKEVKIQDLSLELLKRYYGAILPFYQNKQSYFGFGENALCAMFEFLNIPTFNRKYSDIIYRQKPEVVEHLAQATREYNQKHPEKLQAHSRFISQFNKTPMMQKKLQSRIFDEEVKRRMSNSIKQYYSSHPEYGLLRSYLYKKIFPDYCLMMSEVAKNYPMLSKIIGKIESGVKLTEVQKKYYMAYYKECKQLFADYDKIAKTYKKLIEIFNISPNCNSEEKVEEIKAFFEDEQKTKELIVQLRGFPVE